jgi:hypothetical protein
MQVACLPPRFLFDIPCAMQAGVPRNGLPQQGLRLAQLPLLHAEKAEVEAAKDCARVAVAHHAPLPLQRAHHQRLTLHKAIQLVHGVPKHAHAAQCVRVVGSQQLAVARQHSPQERLRIAVPALAAEFVRPNCASSSFKRTAVACDGIAAAAVPA